jgi:catechol 2,3-dioxygenase-like lactoylglutathione lyase family enzyme
VTAPLAVHHLAVVTADLARAEAFYSGVLGLTVVRRWADDAGAPRAVWMTLAGDAFLALERASAAGPRRSDGAPGWHCVSLTIAKSEREAWRSRLAGHGVTVERESDYTLYLRDPDGNLIGLSHWPDACAPPATP